MTRQYDDLMVDIETLGTTPDALILSIGAVFFDRKTRELGPTFHCHIRPATDADGQIDADTVMWWMGQSGEARKALKLGQGTAVSAVSAMYDLGVFTNQHCDPSKVNVWSLPAAFDLVLLDSLHRRHRMSTVWNHWQHRCLRTKVGEQRGLPVVRPEPTLHHDALADAVAQAKWLMAIDAADSAPPVKPSSTALDALRILVDHTNRLGLRDRFELRFASSSDRDVFARSTVAGVLGIWPISASGADPADPVRILGVDFTFKKV